MIGTLDFRQPDEIFPGMLAKWNGLFMKEMLPKLESMAKSVRTDTTAVEMLNQAASKDQIERTDGTWEEMVNPSHITSNYIAQAVSSYKLSHTNGLGLVFIVDRLVKNQATGCLYAVFFDVNSRKVILSERMCEKAGGAGFRNYWFRPVKSSVEQLPKLYKKVKAQS